MRAREVKKILNVTQRTLTNYIHQGLLNPIKINAHHYEYNDDEVYKIINGNKPRTVVTYARVSLRKQKNDLVSQNERLYDFAIRNGYAITEQLQDIKSGMNFTERKAFMKLLTMVINHEVKTVIVENKDRLVRFGFDLVKELFKQHGTEIIVVSDADNKTYEQELTEDLISIIHYYSMKSYSNRRKMNKIKKILSEKESDDEINSEN